MTGSAAQTRPEARHADFSAAEIGAIAHLYRGEVYRSTVWRTRLDNTTNWSVAALGLAMSASYSHPEASALPLILIGVLIVVFMLFEARRYRYFNVWRARARWLETHFYVPVLRGQGSNAQADWVDVLARDYCEPRHHISMPRAIGRRLRRTYSWLLLIQAAAYIGKIAIHPTPVGSFDEFVARAAIGPVPGWLILVLGLMFYVAWLAVGLYTLRVERRAHGTAWHVSMG